MFHLLSLCYAFILYSVCETPSILFLDDGDDLVKFIDVCVLT